MSKPLPVLTSLFSALLPLMVVEPIQAQDEALFELRHRPDATTAPERALELPLGWRGPMPTVEVWVNAEGPFTFAIDTGGQGSARVSPELIERLQLPVVGEIQGGDPTGRQTMTMPVVELELIELGEVQFEGVQAASRSYAAIPGGPAIDGILGCHLFSDLVLTLDYENERMILEKPPFFPPRGATLIPLISDPNSVPMVEATLGELPLELYIDTGKMGGLGVPAKLIEKLTPVGEPRVIGRGRSITGEIEIHAVDVEESFAMGDLIVERPSVDYSDLLDVSIVGSKFLAGHVLTVNQSARWVWIRTATEDLRMAERDNAPEVTTVDEDFEVEIDLSTGRPWLDVVIEDRDPVPFLFDTGASVTVLDDDYAKSLGFESLGKRAVGDPSSPKGIDVDVYLIPELSFGAAYFENVPAVAMDLDAVFRGGGPAPKAILGLPVFTDVSVTLDYAAGVLRVEREPLPSTLEGAGALLPFSRGISGGSLPEFQIDVAGLTLGAHVDSGAPGGLSLPSSVMGDIPLLGEPQVAGQARTVNGSFDILFGSIDGEVRLGSWVVPGSRVVFMPRLLEANLGGAFLQQHVVTIDLRSRLMLFTPSSLTR